MLSAPKDGIAACVKTNRGKVCALACKEGLDFSHLPALFYVCENSTWSVVTMSPADLSVYSPMKCEGIYNGFCFITILALLF